MCLEERTEQAFIATSLKQANRQAKEKQCYLGYGHLPVAQLLFSFEIQTN